MNKKKMEKVLSIIMIAIVIIFNVLTIVNAVDYGQEFEPSSVTGKDSTMDTGSVQNLGQSIFAVVRVAGILISVIILVVLGIKYMMGSAEEKSEYKKTLLPYAIGAFLIFAAANISQILYNAFVDFSATGS